MHPPAGLPSEGEVDLLPGSQEEIARNEERLQTLHEGRTTGKDESLLAGAGPKDYLDGNEDFSDELLVVVGFQQGGLARRLSTRGIARIEERSGKTCAVM